MELKCNKLIKDKRESSSSLEFIFWILWSEFQTVARALWTLTRIRKFNISYLDFTTACFNEKKIIWNEYTRLFVYVRNITHFATYWGPGYQNQAHTQLTKTRCFANYQNAIIHSVSYFMNITSWFSWVKYLVRTNKYWKNPGYRISFYEFI